MYDRMWLLASQILQYIAERYTPANDFFLAIGLPTPYRIPDVIVACKPLLKVATLNILHHDILVRPMLKKRIDLWDGIMFKMRQCLRLLLKTLACLLNLLRIVGVKVGQHRLDHDCALKGSLILCKIDRAHPAVCKSLGYDIVPVIQHLIWLQRAILDTERCSTLTAILRSPRLLLAACRAARSKRNCGLTIENKSTVGTNCFLLCILHTAAGTGWCCHMQSLKCAKPARARSAPHTLVIHPVT